MNYERLLSGQNKAIPNFISNSQEKSLKEVLKEARKQRTFKQGVGRDAPLQKQATQQFNTNR